MLDKFGFAGICGCLLVLGGVGLVAVESLYVAAGIAFVVSGIGLVAYGFITTLLRKLGVGNVF